MRKCLDMDWRVMLRNGLKNVASHECKQETDRLQIYAQLIGFANFFFKHAMKYKIILMLSALLFATAISKGRGSDGNLEKVKGFLKDVADDKGHFDAIMRDHICAIDDQKKEERLSLLRQQLASLREELRSLPV